MVLEHKKIPSKMPVSVTEKPMKWNIQELKFENNTFTFYLCRKVKVKVSHRRKGEGGGYIIVQSPSSGG